MDQWSFRGENTKGKEVSRGYVRNNHSMNMSPKTEPLRQAVNPETECPLNGSQGEMFSAIREAE